MQQKLVAIVSHVVVVAFSALGSKKKKKTTITKNDKKKKKRKREKNPTTPEKCLLPTKWIAKSPWQLPAFKSLTVKWIVVDEWTKIKR